MGTETGISYAGSTWNPWQGCAHVSEGCGNCYMFREMKRYGRDPDVVRRSADATFFGIASPKKYPPGRIVFVCSWSDWFHADADAWRPEAWELIRSRPDLMFLIVTKRIERAADHLPADWRDGWDNVCLMPTTENQRRFDERYPILAELPAAWKMLSIGPMLGPITLPEDACVDGIVVEGEAGTKTQKIRPLHADWPRSLRDQCFLQGISFHFKQWGDWLPISDCDDHDSFYDPAPEHDPEAERNCRYETMCVDYLGRPGDWSLIDGHGCYLTFRVGKQRAGRLLDGRTWDEMPFVWADHQWWGTMPQRNSAVQC